MAESPFWPNASELHPGTVVDSEVACRIGPAVELVTVGQRRGLNLRGR
ncbi:MAG: hypothetical protein R2789_11795 [Microthrixaceae bacterium]